MSEILLSILGVSSAVVNIIGAVAYLLYIRKGNVKPERAAWWIWTLLMAVALAVQIAQGATWSLLLTASALLGNIAISVLSIHHGYGRFRSYDYVAIVAVLFGLVLWYYTKNPLTALAITILLDFIGSLLIMLKTWRAPYTESLISISLFCLSSVLGLISVGDANQKAIFPAYMVLANASLLLLIYARRKWRSKKIRNGRQRAKAIKESSTYPQVR